MDKEQKIQELYAKQAITEVIYQYCRALDRMDKKLTVDVWHQGGTCDYGNLWAGKAADWVEWVWPVHDSMERTSHTIQNILIELDGDRAATESYFVAYLRSEQDGELADIVFAGRYIDNFECIAGKWRIRHRAVAYDWDNIVPVKSHYDNLPHIETSEPGQVRPRGLRDRNDLSYTVLKGVYG